MVDFNVVVCSDEEEEDGEGGYVSENTLNISSIYLREGKFFSLLSPVLSKWKDNSGQNKESSSTLAISLRFGNW